MKIHLLDGTYELFRNHFGAPPKKAPDGRQVGATLGLVRSLLILLTTPGVTHAARAEQQQSGQDDCAEDWSAFHESYRSRNRHSSLEGI